MISLISPSEVKSPTSIAIGSFDGLHAGHRQLIKSVVVLEIPTSFSSVGQFYDTFDPVSDEKVIQVLHARRF